MGVEDREKGEEIENKESVHSETKSASILQRTPCPSSHTQVRVLKLLLFFKHQRQTSSPLPSKPLDLQFWICWIVKWLLPDKENCFLTEPVHDQEVYMVTWCPANELHVTGMGRWCISFYMALTGLLVGVKAQDVICLDVRLPTNFPVLFCVYNV